MKRLALMTAALASLLVATFALIGTPAAMAATASGTPIVTTGGTLDVTPTTGDLVGTVDLNGATLATAVLTPNCFFEYEAAGSTTMTQAKCANTPAATGVTTVVAPVTALTPGTVYTYTLTVETGGLLGALATATSGSSQTFTTPVAATLPTAATTPATNVAGTTATLNATVNANNWSISSCNFTYNATGAAAVTAPCSALPSGGTAQAVTAAVTGLTPGTAYSYSVSVVYTPASTTATTPPPTATVTSPTPATFSTIAAALTAPANIASTTVTLNGTVNPAGQTVTGCSFYYGASVATLQNTPCAQTVASLSGATTPVSVSDSVTGLTPKTGYTYTLVLTTSGGATAAALGTFTTTATPVPPTATTTAATGVTATTATLHATVNAEGLGIRGCEFEWGVNPLTSSSTPGDDLALTELCASAPADSGNQAVSVTLKGLAPGTKYYSRVLFLTYGGYVVANTVTFTTTAAKIVSTTTPAVKLASYALNKKVRSAKFKIARTGSVSVTKGFQCALVTVTKGKAGTPHYATCPALKTYTKLKATTYVFYARGGNAHGEGKVVSHRFTL